MAADLQQVQKFWEENPLWSGESEYEPGSFEFFQEHRKIYIDDCFAGSFDIRFLPPPDRIAKKCASLTLDVESAFGLWSLPCAV